ncbi:PIN-like domain-containing protein [Streptomyces zingiberis]|uniref:VapC45 PIN like domain-containing protein n=1 Tax=Streptomyces zingiberis TaxID=2053010 RepID=A0ABX1BYY4_9ACTN|nr:hypothetical protein [Streptomyces zingiberis]NJQ02880.1 hypothetical protein [Streptomyces zingiberis]
MSRSPTLRLFLDRSTHGEDFVKGVKELCPDTLSIAEKYGVKAAESVEDELWLAEATQEGRICVGADRRILSSSRPAEIAALLKHRARYLVYANNNMRTADQLRIFRTHLADIRELSATPGPWAYTMAQHGLVLTSPIQKFWRRASSARPGAWGSARTPDTGLLPPPRRRPSSGTVRVVVHAVRHDRVGRMWP